MYRKFIKRVIDFTLSLIAIVVFSPLFIILSIAMLIGMGSPIIFSQERIGLGEKPFKFYKYRSMTNARDADGNLLDETKRLLFEKYLTRRASGTISYLDRQNVDYWSSAASDLLSAVLQRRRACPAHGSRRAYSRRYHFW